MRRFPSTTIKSCVKHIDAYHVANPHFPINSIETRTEHQSGKEAPSFSAI